MDAVTEDLGSQWIAEHFFSFFLLSGRPLYGLAVISVGAGLVGGAAAPACPALLPL